MIRWGIIGAGNIAHRFARSLEKEEGAELYAISGRNEEKLKAFQKEFPCEKYYVGHDGLLSDPDVDAVYIALPHNMHKEWAVKALKAHKAVLCEKPAVMNAEEMQEIADTARQEHVLFMEAMKTRFVPAYRKIRELVEQGTIGKIASVKAENCFLLPEEEYGKTYLTNPDGGGALLDSGCYGVSWISQFMTGNPRLIRCHADLKDGIDLYSDTELAFDNGSARLISGIDRNSGSRVFLQGTEGSVQCDVMHRPTKFTVTTEKGEKKYSYPYVIDDFHGEIDAFCQLMKEGKTESPEMSLNDSLRNAEILDCIRTGFTDYSKKDAEIIEKQEQLLRYDSFDSEEALQLGEKIIELQKEYDRGVSIQIVREPDDLIWFQYVMKGKDQHNLKYAEEKHQAVKQYGHSSAWVNICSHFPDFQVKEGVLPSGGAFPIRLKDGSLAASVLVSGLHEGKDHELIVRALSEILHISVPESIRALG